MYTRGWAISATPNRLHWPKLQNIEKISIFHSSSNITACAQWNQMTKPAKPKIREINWSSIFDEFFWYEVHGMTGNGSYVYLLKNPPKIREISISSLCLATVWRFFWIWSACNDRKRKLCEIWTSQLNLNAKNTVKKNVVPKIINIGFIVETTSYSIVHILGYILSYILDS